MLEWIFGRRVKSGGLLEASIGVTPHGSVTPETVERWREACCAHRGLSALLRYFDVCFSEAASAVTDVRITWLHDGKAVPYERVRALALSPDAREAFERLDLWVVKGLARVEAGELIVPDVLMAAVPGALTSALDGERAPVDVTLTGDRYRGRKLLWRRGDGEAIDAPRREGLRVHFAQRSRFMSAKAFALAFSLDLMKKLEGERLDYAQALFEDVLSGFAISSYL